MKKKTPINLELSDSEQSLEKIEEEIIEAVEKTGKKNVIVNIFTYPHRQLKKRWQVRYKFNKKHLVMDSIIAGIVLFLIGLNIFWMWGGFHYFGDKIEVELITKQESVGLADYVDVEVKYSNDNKFALQDFNLTLTLPDNYELISVSKDDYDYNHNTLALGDLKSGANGSFDIKLQAFGDTGTAENLILNASYYKTNKKGERLWGQFYKTVVQKFVISSTFIEVDVTVPTQLVKNQVFTIPFKIINRSDQYLKDITCEKLELRVFWDNSIIASEDGYIVQDFQPGQEVEFVVNHTAWSEDTNDKSLYYELIWTKNGKEFKQWANGQSVKVFDPALNFNFKLDVDGAVTPGDLVPMTISYKNEGNYTIESLVIKLDFGSNYWELNKFISEDNIYAQTSDGVQYLVWDYKKIPSLGIIQPGESRVFEVQVPIKSRISGVSSVNVGASLIEEYKVEGQSVQVYGNNETVKLNSNFSMQVYPMYFASTGDQLGRGPIPPRVGQETKYWIFVKMINDINDVSNVSVHVKLPFNVVWLDESSVSVGDPLVYDSETKTVNWKISKVPAGSENIGFAFQVAIIPTEVQKGTYPLLLSETKVSGSDQFTGKLIEKNLGSISTKLIYDEIGKVKDGVVK